jgi:NAD(P)H-dependent FMN reductase
VAIVNYGGSAGGYRGAEQLRQVLIELKVVPVREQVGVGIPAIWAAFDAASEPQSGALDGALEAMAAELLWWAAALIPARDPDRETVAAGA